MAESSAIHSHSYSLYTPGGRRTLLVALVSIAILTPTLITDYLEPVVTFFPIVALIAIAMVRTGWPSPIPTWTIFNIFSVYLMIYAGYSFGTTLPPKLLILFLLGMLVYDLVGVKGGQMQSMAAKMISYGIPIFILVPHSKTFSFEKFRDIVSDEGLEGLHGSDQGISMLGIGDGFLPSALAVSAGAYGTTAHLGVLSLTLPQLTTALGGIVGLAILMWADLPKAIAALIVSVPGALIGLGVGLLAENLLL